MTSGDFKEKLRPRPAVIFRHIAPDPFKYDVIYPPSAA